MLGSRSGNRLDLSILPDEFEQAITFYAIIALDVVDLDVRIHRTQ